MLRIPSDKFSSQHRSSFGAVYTLTVVMFDTELTYFKVPTDMAWGTLENGSWNGMVKMVHSNQVDIAISEFTMTKNRLDVVDYTMPLLFKR
ncbi:unnamed protein product [Timema podura]|uniref:Ionotropic glutamate receptor L-glutamate and glycine-binding domain-containing protein n=1 Tax=Timema podura TaxID=61482 RepID=A0ABN7NRJ6_TIMPD|nr:unnamed protein product [Timema podura]